MIRSVEAGDRAAVARIAQESGLFSEGELLEVSARVEAFLQGQLDGDHHWITHADPSPEGVAYFAPEGFSDGVWNLYMLAVRPEAHGRGVGAALVDEVVRAVRERDGRILLVETSGADDFARTRDFYAKCGFTREATLRDYYGEGDHKVVFRKALGGATVAPETDRLRQIALGVTDLDRAARFYGEVLGLTSIARFDPPGLLFFDLGGVRLLLERVAESAPGHWVLYLDVPDIEARVQALEAQGVSFSGPPHCIHLDADGTFGAPGTEEWMAFFSDPDGNTLALVERRSPSEAG